MLSIIVAAAENFAIGKNNDLIWHISADLRRFKALTTGHTVVMGRRTFDSLPSKPLPKRRNIVLTHDLAFQYPGVEVAHSVEEVLNCAKADEELFVMGGAAIYRQLLPHAHKLYVTWVHASYPDADVFFPPINQQEFRQIRSTEPETDPNCGLVFHYADYERMCRHPAM